MVDFFAGSGSLGQAVMQQNALDGGRRRFIVVQLPEPSGREDYPTITEITKERLRRAALAVKTEHPDCGADLGFRVMTLDTSNIRVWDPVPDDLENSILAGLDHIEAGRTEQDILTEVLLKHGLDLCVPIETRIIAAKSVHSIGAGTLIACLDEVISLDAVEPLGQGIAEWYEALAPAGENKVFFRDSAFADDVTKTNLMALLEQRGLGNVQSL